MMNSTNQEQLLETQEPQSQDTKLLFSRWKERPGPTTLTPLMISLEPTIKSSLQSYGGANDPNLRSTAQLQIIKSLPRYDPAKAGLSTFVFNELKRMRRLAPKQQYAIPIPEQASLDLKNVQLVEGNLQAELGREPTVSELADATSLSPRRIQSIKVKYAIPTITDQQYENSTELPTTREQASEKLWTDVVYSTLDPIDQKIMDWSLGWHGQEQLSKTEMARRLRMSVPAITQRAQRIAAKMEEGTEYNLT